MSATFADVRDVAGILQDPEVGESELEVPKEWETWDGLFQKVRDCANDFIDVANEIPGIDLPTFPDGSLADLVIKPFTGDWDRIRANGTACGIAGDGISAYADNISGMAVEMAKHWDGKAALSFDGHAAIYVLVMKAVSKIVKAGHLVFETIGATSQKLGEVAIRIIVVLGKLLSKIVSKILARFGGWWSAIKTGAEIIAHGLEPVRDIYEGVKTIIELVGRLSELKDRAEEFIDTMVAGLKTMNRIGEIANGLPTYLSGVGVSGQNVDKVGAQVQVALGSGSADPTQHVKAADYNIQDELKKANEAADKGEKQTS